MKKILAWLMLLTLVVGLFAGCNQTGTEAPTTAPQGETVNGAQDAIDYLKAYYTDNGAQTPIDYTRFGIVRIGGVAYDVVWTTDAPEDLIKIVKNEDGTYKIDINEDAAEDTEYTLTATVTDANGNTASYTWNYILPKAQDMVAIVEAAYALANGESLPYESRLRGKVISIDSIYTEDYQNITVTIEIEGAEDKPIKCYRMKGTAETVELLPDVKVGNIITVTGILKNYQGTIEFDTGCLMIAWEKGDAIEAPTDPGEILKAAYALGQDQVLPYVATLTGTVTKIDSPYDPAYGNISVEIVVDGYPQYPILCYRLKGLGVDQIAVNDLITVSGIIKNYKGTIEYDSGCQMTNRVSGGGVAQGPSSDPNKIIPDALKLNPGEKLPYRATLTGEIYSVDQAYDAAYGNVTVTIKVQGYKFQCYRMVGDGVDKIRVTDTITVSGIIENYNGKLEFGAKCTLDSWTMGSRVETINYGPLKENTPYSLKMDLPDGTVYFTGDQDGNFLATSKSTGSAVTLYMEKTEGEGVRFYFMNGTAKKYIELVSYINSSGKEKAKTVIVDTPTTYWNYNTEAKVYVIDVNGTKYYMGTYTNSSTGTTFSTISCSSTYYIIDGNAYNVGKTQFVAQFVDAVNDGTTTEGTSTVITEPEVGVAYKLGFDQLNKQAIYYFTGAMSGYYYGATETDATLGVDVYLETADGGYKAYFTDGNGVKQYLLIAVGDDGTHINFKFSDSSASVFVFDTERNSLYTTLDDGSVHYMGTNGTFVTVNTIKDANKDKTDYYLSHLYVTTGSGGPSSAAPTEPEPSEPSQPSGTVATVVETPEVATAYKFGLDKGDGKVLYFTGNTESASVTYRLETSDDATKAVDVYLEAADGGYYLYFMKDGVKTYINMKHYEDGDPGYGKGSLEFVTEQPANVMTYDETAKTMFYDYDGKNAYYMGTYGTYVTMSVSNTSYITGDNAGNVDSTQFPARFYTVEIGEPGTTEPGTTEPGTTEPGTTEPGTSVGMIDKIDNLTAGTYFMSGYLTSYSTNSSSYDYTSAPYHVWDGTVITDSNSNVDLNTVQYSYAAGVLTGTGAGEMKLVAVSGKANTYYIMVGDQYLSSTAYANRRLALSDTQAEWVATNNSNGGITMTTTLSEGTISLGTAGAGSKLLRSYKNESTLKYGLLFFPADGSTVEPGGSTEPPVTEPDETEPSTPSTGNQLVVNFANLTAGEQYSNEHRDLGGGVTLDTVQCQVKTTLRIYQDDNYNANAVFSSTKAIKSIVLNAGHKVASLDIYGSNDGTTWSKVTTLSISSTTYNDYTVDMPAGTSYKYLKLDAVDAQIRVAAITFNFED